MIRSKIAQLLGRSAGGGAKLVVIAYDHAGHYFHELLGYMTAASVLGISLRIIAAKLVDPAIAAQLHAERAIDPLPRTWGSTRQMLLINSSPSPTGRETSHRFGRRSMIVTWAPVIWCCSPSAALSSLSASARGSRVAHRAAGPMSSSASPGASSSTGRQGRPTPQLLFFGWLAPTLAGGGDRNVSFCWPTLCHLVK